MKINDKINNILNGYDDLFENITEAQKEKLFSEDDLEIKITNLISIIREDERKKNNKKFQEAVLQISNKDFLPRVYDDLREEKEALELDDINDFDLRRQTYKLQTIVNKEIHFWKSLVDFSSLPIFIINKDRSFKYFNEQFLNESGWERSEIYSVKGASSIFWPHDPQNCPICKIVKKYDTDLLKSGYEETQMMTKDKKIIPVTIFVVPVYYENGDLAYTFGMVESKFEEYNRRSQFLNEETMPIIDILDKIANKNIKENISLSESSELSSLEVPINKIVDTLREIISMIINSTNFVENSSDDVKKIILSLSDWYKNNFLEVQNSLQAMFDKMETSISKVVQVINLIQNIADQTNLLSLNASIVANKAGEYGRGFAVVASEVRQLAKNSYDAANDVSHVIEEIQSNTVETSMRMKDSREESKALQEYLEKISGETDKIENIVSKLAENIRGFKL